MLRTCTTSTDLSLLSLEAYKIAVGTTSTGDDDKITAALRQATSLVEGYVGYPLRRQVYEETIGGYGGNELLVGRSPLLAIESITYAGELVDPSSYDFNSAGLIYRELGWPWTAGLEYDLMPHVIPKSEARTYTVVYESGFCVNGSTADGWLTTGESVPEDIQAALVSTTSLLYKGAGRDPSVTSKKIGDLSITYQSGGSAFGQGGTPSQGLPDTVKGMIAQYRRF
jgi:hypothetical protein